ncbi:betaine/proline/choline family ABC transporter ATP-binding protein [Pseudomonas putida]|uniref:quaternary amine ABC transporter ATP-binding protein n=1 Tax=Pseudomonas putida TaxID=303 RepID=UPI00300E8BA1
MNKMNKNSPASSTVVECRDVWKIFGNQSPAALDAAKSLVHSKDELLEKFGSVVAVAGATFKVHEGETFCIIGLSGSGKSTLIRHFNRLIDPTCGEVLVHGKDICKMSPTELRGLRSNKIGMVFQHVALLPYRTVIQNVMLPLEVQGVSKQEALQKSQASLDKVGLGNWANRFPQELSGGMQQRVGIARALAADPDVLLMDEPFSALDPLIRKQLQVEFKKLSTDLRKTTIFITHDIDEAIRIGDRIAIMKEGRLIQVGTPEEVVLNPADAYVASFMEGISRLKLLRARSMLKRLDQHPTLEIGGRALDALVSVNIDADLETLIDISLGEAEEVVAIKDGSQIVGTVSRETLLKAVRGLDLA